MKQYKWYDAIPQLLLLGFLCCLLQLFLGLLIHGFLLHRQGYAFDYVLGRLMGGMTLAIVIVLIIKRASKWNWVFTFSVLFLVSTILVLVTPSGRSEKDKSDEIDENSLNESTIRSFFNNVEECKEILSTVKDEESAQVAAGKLESLLTSLGGSARGLNWLTVHADKNAELIKKVDQDLKNAAVGFRKTLENAKKLSDQDAEFEKVYRMISRVIDRMENGEYLK
jgi:hypothetical protein